MKIKILVVSHDAGGANILNALVKKYNTDFDWKVYAKGPAIKIFRKYRNAERIIEASDIEHMLNIEKPDLVLLDLILPGIDGFEVLSQMRKESALSSIPVIILSNLGQKEDVEKGLKMGAVDYLIKAHFTPGEIIDKIKSALK